MRPAAKHHGKSTRADSPSQAAKSTPPPIKQSLHDKAHRAAPCPCRARESRRWAARSPCGLSRAAAWSKSAPISTAPHAAPHATPHAATARQAATSTPPKKQSPQSCPFMCPSEPRSLWSDPGAASEVQGRRRSPRRCWPAHARAPELGLRRPLLVTTWADPPRSKPTELPNRARERAAQPLVGPRGRKRGPGPLLVPAQLTWRTATTPPPALEGQLLVAIGAKPHEAKPTELHVATPKPGAQVRAVLKGRQSVPSPLSVPG